MEKFESNIEEKKYLNKDFIIERLDLVSSQLSQSDKFLKLKPAINTTEDTAAHKEEVCLDSPEKFQIYFEGISLQNPDKMCRPKGDTTYFTSAGVQKIETILRERGHLEKEKFIIAQPSIRSQFMDKIKDGTSTSFVNVSVESIFSSPDEFIDLSGRLIQMILNQGVMSADLDFHIETLPDAWGNRQFNKTVLTIYCKGIEVAECVYIQDYPMTQSEKVAITDIGLGIERLRWGIGKDEYYLPEYRKFYEDKTDQDRVKIMSIIDCIRSMVLIVGDGVRPSNHDHGYRARQFSKRFVLRNRGVDLNVDELIYLSHENWEKWGYKLEITTENIINIIRSENDRNFNSLFLLQLRETEGINMYADINQSTVNFLHQIRFSLPQLVVNKLLNLIK